MRGWVELSGEWPDLAWQELLAASEASGLRGGWEAVVPGLATAEDIAEEDLRRLVRRMALARRGWIDRGPLEDADLAPRTPGEPARIRRRGHPTGQSRPDPAIDRLARRWVAEGGTIDLDSPRRRLWIGPAHGGAEPVWEEVAEADRRAVMGRRLSRLPFHRPVGLDPRLARAAANLALAGPGRTIVDPFAGTGALLAEAALLGSAVWGIDRDPEMIRGAVRNFDFLGLAAARWIAADAESAASAPEIPDRIDGILTDVPYGRSSGTGGEAVDLLVARVLGAWAGRVGPRGRIVVVTHGGPDPLASPWAREAMVAVRQHRSLTREFRVYRRREPAGPVREPGERTSRSPSRSLPAEGRPPGWSA
ncbi:MAG: hypothetical protein QXG65_02450 [Thermoplasmata archaeon]